MKILACCSGGIDRSVGLKASLLVNGRLGPVDNMINDLIPIGLNANSAETKEMLFAWADIICVCGEAKLLELVPEKYKAKTRHYDVGHDTYGSPNHWALINKFRHLLGEQPL